MVRTAGTTLAKSSTKSRRPVSITSSMHARVKSAMSGSHSFTAAGERNGLRIRRYSDCSGGSISMKPPRVDPALGDRDALVPVALAVGIVVVRQQVGALGERAQLLVAGDDPEAVVARCSTRPGTARAARAAGPDRSRGTRASAGRTRRRPDRPLPSQPPGCSGDGRPHAYSRRRWYAAPPSELAESVACSARWSGSIAPERGRAPARRVRRAARIGLPVATAPAGAGSHGTGAARLRVGVRRPRARFDRVTFEFPAPPPRCPRSSAPNTSPARGREPERDRGPGRGRRDPAGRDEQRVGRRPDGRPRRSRPTPVPPGSRRTCPTSSRWWRPATSRRCSRGRSECAAATAGGHRAGAHRPRPVSSSTSRTSRARWCRTADLHRLTATTLSAARAPAPRARRRARR